MAREYWLRFFLKGITTEKEIYSFADKFAFPDTGLVVNGLPVMSDAAKRGTLVIFWCGDSNTREQIKNTFILTYSDNINRCDYMTDVRPWIQSEKDYK